MRFETNIVVVRERAAGRTLDSVVARQREALAARLPRARVARQGPTRLGDLEGYEVEVVVPLAAPLPTLKQWHASMLRGEHAYHFCGTATQAAYDGARERFVAFAYDWAQATTPA